MREGFIKSSYITKGAYLCTGRKTRHGHKFFVSSPPVPQKSTISKNIFGDSKEPYKAFYTAEHTVP